MGVDQEKAKTILDEFIGEEICLKEKSPTYGRLFKEKQNLYSLEIPYGFKDYFNIESIESVHTDKRGKLIVEISRTLTCMNTDDIYIEELEEKQTELVARYHGLKSENKPIPDELCDLIIRTSTAITEAYKDKYQ